MNFLFLISLFAVTVSGNPLAPIMADPHAFVASLQNADPEVIQKMLDLVTQLQGEGEEDLASATEDATSKRSVSTVRAGELNAAIATLAAAQGALEAATGKKNELVGSEAVEKAALDKATADRDAAQDDADKKASSRADVTARVENENEELGGVLSLLDTIVVPGDFDFENEGFDSDDYEEQIDNADSVNFDAIDQIKAQIQGLIDAANDEAAAAVEADEAAAGVLEGANGVHQGALDQHTKTAGQLQSAIIDVEGKTESRNTASTEKQEADRISYAANVDADDAESFLSDETTRVTSEAATLAEVQELLEGLL